MYVLSDRACGHGGSRDDVAGGIGTTHVPADFGDWTAIAAAPAGNVQRRFPYSGQWDNKTGWLVCEENKRTPCGA